MYVPPKVIYLLLYITLRISSDLIMKSKFLLALYKLPYLIYELVFENSLGTRIAN